jgi:hypothetical protein
MNASGLAPGSHLDEAPKATFPSVLLRQRGAIGVMRIDRACNISMRRERIYLASVPRQAQEIPNFVDISAPKIIGSAVDDSTQRDAA